jgi:hypothetical protein
MEHVVYTVCEAVRARLSVFLYRCVCVCVCVRLVGQARELGGFQLTCFVLNTLYVCVQR